MDRYKIEHFEQTRNEPFPPFESLGDAECARIRETIAGRIVLPRDADRLTIVETLFDQSIALDGMNAEDDDFSLERLLTRSEIALPERLAIDWYRFDNIDRFAFAEANRHFRDIWYPSADDITLFDATLKWFVWIDHSGDISVNYL